MEERRFSPARLARVLGVSESTLKRWIDSGHLRAEKTPGGHRKIALPDVIGFLRARGRPAPSLEALGLLVAQASDGATSAAPEALAGLLLRGEFLVARAVVLDEFRKGRPLDEMLDRLVGPAMAELGERWARREIDVYEEHLATYRAWLILVEVRGLLPAPAANASLALGAAPEGDPYLLPGLMAELTLLEMGWRTLYLGPDTPMGSLRRAIETHAPRLVWLSITSARLPDTFVPGYQRVLEAAQARGAGIVLGGQGLTPALRDRLVASGFGSRLAHLRAFALSLDPSPGA